MVTGHEKRRSKNSSENTAMQSASRMKYVFSFVAPSSKGSRRTLHTRVHTLLAMASLSTSQNGRSSYAMPAVGANAHLHSFSDWSSTRKIEKTIMKKMKPCTTAALHEEFWSSKSSQMCTCNHSSPRYLCVMSNLQCASKETSSASSGSGSASSTASRSSLIKRGDFRRLLLLT